MVLCPYIMVLCPYIMVLCPYIMVYYAHILWYIMVYYGHISPYYGHIMVGDMVGEWWYMTIIWWYGGLMIYIWCTKTLRWRSLWVIWSVGIVQHSKLVKMIENHSAKMGDKTNDWYVLRWKLAYKPYWGMVINGLTGIYNDFYFQFPGIPDGGITRTHIPSFAQSRYNDCYFTIYHLLL